MHLDDVPLRERCPSSHFTNGRQTKQNVFAVIETTFHVSSQRFRSRFTKQLVRFYFLLTFINH